MPENIQRCNFSVGDTIDGRYQVKKILGEGTFGIVYSVQDYQGSVFALKLLRLWEVHPEIRSGLVKRFDMEFETGQIASDYLVHSLYHGFAYGNPYIVMELCTGGDLISLSEHSVLDLPQIATHVLNGLGALHSCGKVHRDLKPENVLLKANGNFALTDFGICGDRNKRMTECNILGKPQQIFGTYAYMPPEQLNPRKNTTVLPTTDIFSFGVMMYQLLTGSLPFGRLDDESDLMGYLKKGKNGDWDRNKLIACPNGSQWEHMIDGCLQPKFQDRLQTVNEVLELIPDMPREKKIKEPVQSAPPYQTKIVNGVLLRIMQGEDYGMVYYLDNMLCGEKSILTMGRKDSMANNDIPITENNSSYVSRCHCTLELDYNIGSWVVRDGQWIRGSTGGGWRPSTNGTFVNSTEVSRMGMVFNPGDIISIGDTKLRAEGY